MYYFFSSVCLLVRSFVQSVDCQIICCIILFFNSLPWLECYGGKFITWGNNFFDSVLFPFCRSDSFTFPFSMSVLFKGLRNFQSLSSNSTNQMLCLSFRAFDSWRECILLDFSGENFEEKMELNANWFFFSICGCVQLFKWKYSSLRSVNRRDGFVGGKQFKRTSWLHARVRASGEWLTQAK